MRIKQSINLLLSKEHDQDNLFIRVQFFYRWHIALVAVLITIWVLNSTVLYYHQSSIYDIEEQISALDKKSVELKLQLSELSSHQSDLEYINTQNKLVREKVRLLDYLKGQRKVVYFSTYLNALSENKREGMQLNEIEIKSYGQYIDFKGETVSSDILTKWILSLEKSNAYDGLKFERIFVERNQISSHLTFEVKSFYEQE